MKKGNQKGLAVVDISIAIIVLFIFISVISILAYNFSSSSKEVELKSHALEIAIREIETMKNKSIEELETEDINYRSAQEIETGFIREILVQDYSEINPDKMSGIVKKITVKIQYKFKKQIETVELSTVVSKGS